MQSPWDVIHLDNCVRGRARIEDMMATPKFLLQGFTSGNHLDALRHLFDLSNLEKVIVSVAFLNEAGVDLLSSELSNNGSKTLVFAGVRNDITSLQGLNSLMEHGAKVHYVDTGARQLIFHPKIYFARAKTKARLVLGSANLTLGGLNNNIEASVVFELDFGNPDDEALAYAVEAAFANLTAEYPQHVVRVKGKEDLEELQKEGRLVDESSSDPPTSGRSAGTGMTDGLGRIKLKLDPLKRSVLRPRFPRLPKASDADETTPTKVQPVPTGGELVLVWQSKPLVERDLSIPSSATANPTGSINLDKGLLSKEIDHRHYFRDEVFAELTWKKTRRRTVDEAFANFGLIVTGVDHGEFPARIGHTTSKTSAAYRQRNAMTRLSWGPMKEFVARRSLINRTMSLYRHARHESRFVIEID